MTARKVKVSVSLDADVVSAVDRLAQTEGASRSAVMERWLTQMSRQAKLARLEEETAAYYEAQTAGERDEDAAWAIASSQTARRMRIDDEPHRHPAHSPRRPPRRRGG